MTVDRLDSVRLRLFGSLRCSVAGEPHALAFLPRVLPLLALVAGRAPEPLRRDALAFTLWPDDTEAQALAKLRRHIHSARTAFPSEFDPLVVDKLHVALNDQGLWCDVAAFEKRVRPATLPLR